MLLPGAKLDGDGAPIPVHIKKWASFTSHPVVLPSVDEELPSLLSLGDVVHHYHACGVAYQRHFSDFTSHLGQNVCSHIVIPGSLNTLQQSVTKGCWRNASSSSSSSSLDCKNTEHRVMLDSEFRAWTSMAKSEFGVLMGAHWLPYFVESRQACCLYGLVPLAFKMALAAEKAIHSLFLFWSWWQSLECEGCQAPLREVVA